MRFLSVRADSFGPFPADATLPLTPGLNIVYGPNEAGKSSWHAAIYAGLCGIRRGKGKPAVEDQAFAEKHRPWSHDESSDWAVTTLVELQDGRLVELHWDLVSKTAEIADPATGRRLPLDLINEGSPDGALLLGLDRRAFIATACVGQAELLRVRDSSKSLHEYLQKAVATGRDDATVVGALNALGGYFDDFVGSDQAWTKPWRKAGDLVTRLTRELQEAEAAHEAHLALIGTGEVARSEAEKARHRLDLVLARQAALEANRLQARFQRAAELQPLFAAGPPPAALDDEELANSVAAALTRWQNQPEGLQLKGTTAAQIRLQLADLPQVPSGDVEPHASVLTARDRRNNASTALDQHAALEPVLSPATDSGGLSDDELRQLAFDLRRVAERTGELGPPDQVPAANIAKAPPVWLIGSGVLAALGLVMLLLSPPIGAILLAVGLAAAAWGFVSRSRAERADSGTARVKVETRMRAEESERLRIATEARARAAGLPADPSILLALAESIAAARTRREGWEIWTQHRSGLKSALVGSEEALRRALQQRGIEPGTDLAADVAAYEEACHLRQAAATEAGRRPGMEAQLEAQEVAEKAAAEATLQQQQAKNDIIALAAKCGIREAEESQMVEALRGWMEQRALRLKELDEQLNQWTELRQLLDDLTLDQLDAARKELRKTADELARDLTAGELSATSLEPDVKSHVASLRLGYQELAQSAAELKGRIETEAGQVVSVSLAKEELAAAKAELKRVSRLRDTIRKTREFLGDAQDRVNHEIAPVLNDLVGRRLSQVTGGRYSEVRVDPEDLNVRVRLPNGIFQLAYLISHGTAEQVYLLLRVAMAERLTKPGEVCPLILDDVTVQSDGERTRCILETLLTISTERQIILFSQEEAVLAWAEANVENNGKGQLVRLNGIAASA